MKKQTIARIFRFNKDSDYLSYYKPYVLKAGKKRIIDILDEAREQDDLFTPSYQNTNFVLIDGFVHSLQDELDLDELIIEPIATDLSTKDFELNKNDFWQKFTPFEKYCDDDDKNYYRQNFVYYAISPIRKIIRDFVGEAALLLAKKLIDKNPVKELEILRLIASAENGIWNYTKLESIFKTKLPNSLDKDVADLKSKIIDYGLEQNIKQRLFDNVNAHMPSIGDLKKLKNMNVGVYYTNYANETSLHEKLHENNIKTIVTQSSYAPCAMELTTFNADVFDELFGEIWIDFFDKGAHILLTPNKELTKLARTRKPKIEKKIGRKIDIEVVCTSELGN